MQDYSPHWRRLARLLLIAITIVCASRTAAARSDPRLGTVHYQVIGSDGQISNLPNVPQTNKGIKSVLRVAAIGTEPPVRRRAKILSTKHPLLQQTAPDPTFRTQLTWNGTAWIGSTADRRQQLTVLLTTKNLHARANRKRRLGREHPLVGSLRELQNKRMFWQLAGIDIEADMFERAGTRAAGRRRWDLAAVGAIQRNVDNSIDQHKKVLAKMAKRGELGRGFTLPDKPQIKPIGATGKVVASKLDPNWTNAAGIAKPINNVHILPYRTQIWATPPQTGRRTYHVTMAHAEAGTFGAFYYVAYIDSTGDGVPDTQIARSALAMSDRPGQWTSWSFITRAKRVFIGHSWPIADTAIYSRRISGAQWLKLGAEAYTAPVLCMPPTRPGGPYISNCRVYSTPTPIKPTTQPATRPAGD
jgi:hypothetical protein